MGERGKAVEGEEEEVEEDIAVLLLTCVTGLTCLTGLEIEGGAAAAVVVAVIEGVTDTVGRDAITGLPPVEEDGELVT